MLVRSSPSGYSDITSGNMFYYCPLPHAVFVLLHGQPPASLICLFAFGLRFIYSDLCSTLVLLPSKVGLLSTVARCPYHFVRPSDDDTKHVLNKTGVLIF